MNNRGFILNIVAIVVVLGIVFFSQNGHFSVKEIPFQAWVEARGGELTRQASQIKETFAQHIFDQIKNYFVEKFNSFFKTEVK